MTFDDELAALGPRIQPRPGGSTWQADAEFFRRYLALFPKDSDERLRRYLDREQARRGSTGQLSTIARNGVRHAA